MASTVYETEITVGDASPQLLTFWQKYDMNTPWDSKLKNCTSQVTILTFFAMCSCRKYPCIPTEVIFSKTPHPLEIPIKLHALHLRRKTPKSRKKKKKTDSKLQIRVS